MNDAVEYKNGQKNNWRARLWNVLHANIRQKYGSIVLYLPGSQDLDRAQAIRKGFQDANLIAVESNPKVARELRKRGVNVIIGSLSDVIDAWPDHVPVSAVIADLQQGLDDEITRICDSWGNRSAFLKSALLVNLQRGRDKVNAWAAPKCIRESSTDNLLAKNRAAMLWIILDAAVAKMANSEYKPGEFFRPFLLQSYISGRVTMDSMVLWTKESQWKYREDFAIPKIKVRRRVAAALAIRTIRINRQSAAA